jgi:hypothetical protein
MPCFIVIRRFARISYFFSIQAERIAGAGGRIFIKMLGIEGLWKGYVIYSYESCRLVGNFRN